MLRVSQNVRRLVARAGVAFAAVVVTAGSANAAAVDVTAVVAEIQGSAAPISAIGSAVLLIMVGIKVLKWIRRAM